MFEEARVHVQCRVTSLCVLDACMNSRTVRVWTSELTERVMQASVAQVNIVDPPSGYSNLLVRFCGQGFGKEGVLQGSIITTGDLKHNMLPVCSVDGCDLHISGDVMIEVRATRAASLFWGEAEDVLCWAWFHTSFVEGDVIFFPVTELDGPPAKDKKREKFSTNFAIEILTRPAQLKRRLSVQARKIHHPESVSSLFLCRVRPTSVSIMCGNSALGSKIHTGEHDVVSIRRALAAILRDLASWPI
jgi:hypothetical protein